jgi:ASC-1-like (ASCH) protein
MADAAVLHLNLHRVYFDEIAQGTKRIEYRDTSDYWARRLQGRAYDVIVFRNGYGPKVPEMWVQFRGVRKRGKGRSGYYAIKLGKVLKILRWRKPKG